MSFASQIKDEAARVPLGSACCQLAELTGLLGACGSLHLRGGGNIGVTFVTEHAPTARRLVSLLSSRFDVRPALSAAHTKRLGGRSAYTLEMQGEDALRVLETCGILRGSERARSFRRDVPPAILARKCCRRAFLRGVFLAAGSMSNPEKEYHLEFVLADGDFAASVAGALSGISLRPKEVRRKGMYVIYLKEAGSIVSFLGQIGAHSALLTLESVRVEKDVRNAVNRAVNCDSANLAKTVDASHRQVEAIEALQRSGTLKRLPDTLREIAEVRLANPEATLQELGEMMDPPIGKSGVNHRLRRLVALAEQHGQAEATQSS